MVYSVDYTLWGPLSLPSQTFTSQDIADARKCVTCQTLAVTVRHLERLDNGASQLDLLMYFCGKEISLPLFCMSVWPFVCYFTDSRA